MEGIHSHEGVKTSVLKPELISYLIPQTGQVIKVISSGKPLNMPCATKMPGVIASSMLTTHVLIFCDICRNPSNYPPLSLLKAPVSVINSVLQLHLPELKVEVEEESFEEFLASEPSKDIQMNYEQMMHTYIRPVYTE